MDADEKTQATDRICVNLCASVDQPVSIRVIRGERFLPLCGFTPWRETLMDCNNAYLTRHYTCKIVLMPILKGV